jgi:hypothetical protein
MAHRDKTKVKTGRGRIMEEVLCARALTLLHHIKRDYLLWDCFLWNFAMVRAHLLVAYCNY